MSAWPALRVADWTDTRETLHMMTQIVGKIRLAQAPLLNHWWQVTLYVSPRGLTTGSVPVGNRIFDLELDVHDQVLAVRASDGGRAHVALRDRPIADFYAETMQTLAGMDFHPRFQARPNEVEPSIPFAEDDTHHVYEPEAALAFWRQLVQADRVIEDFRSHFTGKVSPSHFFWGSFDLACTRFSGRPAPAHPGGAPNCGDWVMVEGYSAELSSCGFWPGGGEEGAFYSYAYPAPEGFSARSIEPDGAAWDDAFQQFLLPYEVVRGSADPDATLLAFLQSTYAAAADLADWDRPGLEDDPSRLDALLARR